MTIIGLAALCTLALSAISASGASAGATAFTCVKGGAEGTNKFSEEDCSTVSNPSGAWGHKAIEVGKTTVLSLTSLTNPTLEGKLFGANVTLEATSVECEGCSAENHLEGGVMEVRGPAEKMTGGKLRFSGVKVVGLPECTVFDPRPIPVEKQITTEALKFTTTVAGEARLEPVTGTTLAVFNITGATCPVAGSGITVTGKSLAKLTGAKLKVEVLKSSLELQLEGEKAALKGEATVKGGATTPENPVALTTA
jgi:hypothetical protein